MNKLRGAPSLASETPRGLRSIPIPTEVSTRRLHRLERYGTSTHRIETSPVFQALGCPGCPVIGGAGTLIGGRWWIYDWGLGFLTLAVCKFTATEFDQTVQRQQAEKYDTPHPCPQCGKAASPNV